MSELPIKLLEQMLPPHVPTCASWSGDLYDWSYPCDCWKKELS